MISLGLSIVVALLHTPLIQIVAVGLLIGALALWRY